MQKIKAGQQGDALLIEQQLRLAFKNEASPNSNLVESTAKLALPEIIISKNCFIETVKRIQIRVMEYCIWGVA